MRILPAALLLTMSVASAADDGVRPVAVIDIDDIDEASGLARSQLDPDILWVLNDDGEPRVYALDATGRKRGRLTLDPAVNRDWEDMSSFTLGGVPYLLVADIGDNQARRKSRQLYVVEEPDLAEDDKVRSTPAWVIDYRYPDGPRDAEAAAVDIEAREVLILSKRDRPPRLYSVPLDAGDETVVATFLGEVRSVPRPRRIDLQLASRLQRWFWQPVAMDIRGSLGLIMTYDALFAYRREPGKSWAAAFNDRPCRISLAGFINAEAASISNDGATIYATVEAEKPPLLRAPFPEENCHE